MKRQLLVFIFFSDDKKQLQTQNNFVDDWVGNISQEVILSCKAKSIEIFCSVLANWWMICFTIGKLFYCFQDALRDINMEFVPNLLETNSKETNNAKETSSYVKVNSLIQLLYILLIYFSQEGLRLERLSNIYWLHYHFKMALYGERQEKLFYSFHVFFSGGRKLVKRYKDLLYKYGPIHTSGDLQDLQELF